MKCPVDNETLVISDRNNIEIDYCPSCRGVWLDRGELDKLIERSSQQHNPAPSPRNDDRYDNHKNDYDNHGYKKKKKESFLGDMFDF